MRMALVASLDLGRRPVNLAWTPAEPVAHAERVMDCGGKRSATPLFDRRPARDATEADRAAESGAALRGSPQSITTSAGAAIARHFRSHRGQAECDLDGWPRIATVSRSEQTASFAP
jgi:hypothetical protein